MRPIYYDTETTGIKADRDRIVEIAAYDPERDLAFEKLINPGVPIPAEAAAVHKITDEMVADKPPFSDIMEEFKTFCEGDTVLIAHNNDGFDVHFLREEFKRADSEMPDWNFIDTLKWARRYRPDLPKHTLQFLREMYGIPANNAHRALEDVKIMHEVFSLMIGDLSIREVFDLLNVKREIKFMPFGKHQGKSFKEVPKDYITWLAGSGALDKPENSQLKETLTQLDLLSA